MSSSEDAPTIDEAKRKEIYDYFEEAMGKVPPSIPSLERYNPGAMEGFYLLRKSTLQEPPHGTLTKKVQELIIIAVEAALKKDPLGHARIAVDAGCTPQEIHDAVPPRDARGGSCRRVH